jgi:ATP-dependent DNA ligase
MTGVLPELGALPRGLVLDGELVAWRKGVPYFPWIVRRVLHNDRSITLSYVIFDLLRVNGDDVTSKPYLERRKRLEKLSLHGATWSTPDVFDDGEALYTAVCEHGLEGIVAKRNRSTYRPLDRSWVKIKNPGYWRRESELEPFRSGGQPNSRLAQDRSNRSNHPCRRSSTRRRPQFRRS